MSLGRTRCSTLRVGLLVLAAGLYVPSWGRTIPVSTPAEIQQAMASAQPGDTLVMRPGLWNNAAILFSGTGNAAAPIVLRSPSYGSVVLTGSSRLSIAGQHLVVDGLLFDDCVSSSWGIIEFRNSATGALAASCRLTNSAVVDCNPPVSTTDYKWISLYGVENRVDHCYLKGKNHAGATFVVWLDGQPNDHRVDSNYFGYRPPLGVNGGETIRVGTSDYSLSNSRTVVERNLFEQCNGEIEVISSKSCENVYRWNTFDRCDGTLTLRHGNRCRVEGNFFLGRAASGSGGIRIIGEDHFVVNNYVEGTRGTDLRAAISIMNGKPNSALNEYYQVKRAVVAFNTLVNNTASIVLGAGKSAELTLPPLDCIIANTVVSSSSGPLIRQTDVPINLLWEGDIVFGSTLGIAQPPGVRVLDPLLVTAPDGLKRPSGSSPAIDAAAGQYDSVLTDMDGQPRSAPKDAGADEASLSAIMNRPLTALDVGPLLTASFAPLAQMTALQEGNGVRVSWMTGAESETVRFAVERAPGGSTQFAQVGSDVTAAGRSLEPLQYALLEGAVGSGRWAYRVRVEYAGGPATFSPVVELDVVTRVDGDPAEIPASFSLHNYPNPFNPGTTFVFALPITGPVRLEVHALTGEKVATVFEGYCSAGVPQAVTWSAPDLSTGTYLARLTAAGTSATRPILLLK
jgi:poly(beta-D-mannuronate) lyase